MNSDLERMLDLEIKALLDRESMRAEEADELLSLIPAYMKFVVQQRAILLTMQHYIENEITPREAAEALRDAADEIEQSARYPDLLLYEAHVEAEEERENNGND